MTRRVFTGHMGMSSLGVGNIYYYMRLFQENKHEHTKVQINTNRHVKHIQVLNQKQHQSFTILNSINYTRLQTTSIFPCSELIQISSPKTASETC